VIVHEIVQGNIFINTFRAKLAVKRVSDLEVILVHQAGIQAFKSFVIGDRIQGLRVGPLCIIPVHHFAQQPKIRFQRAAESCQLAQKIHIQAIRHIQAQPVDGKLVHPGAHRFENVLPHLRIAQVELHQVIVAFPGLVSKSIAVGALRVETHPLEPAGVWRSRAVLLQVAESPKIAPDVIEDPVQDQAHAAGVDFG